MTRTRRVTGGLAGRLMLAQSLVLVTGVLTAALVAAAMGPALFHRHLQEAGVPAPSEAATHAEIAFRSASIVALGAALLAALVAALAVSLFVTGRIGRSVSTVVRAARDLSAGQLQARVPDPGIGPEFESLAAAFNGMADRLEAVEVTRRRMLGDLAHELRTPIATLDGYLEGVEDGVARLDADTMRLLRHQTARLARLAEDVAAVSRAEEGQLDLRLGPVAVRGLLTDAVSAASDRFSDKGVELLADLPVDLPRVQADLERIGQVLGNVLDNALRHTPRGGRVTVRAQVEGEQVVVSVTDTGEGIAAEHLPHVFERFYRAQPARDRDSGGSGIGLAVVKAIVHAHGGSVTARSDGPGTGTSILITLPVR